jgi:hypothetical protein
MRPRQEYFSQRDAAYKGPSWYPTALDHAPESHVRPRQLRAVLVIETRVVSHVEAWVPSALSSALGTAACVDAAGVCSFSIH